MLMSDKYGTRALLSKGALRSSTSTLTTSLLHNANPIPLHQSSQARRFTPARSVPTAFQ